MPKKTIEFCPHCGQKMPVTYKFLLDDSTVALLRAMWDEVIRGGQNEIRIYNLPVPYSIQSRQTQARLHGLITKVKTAKGTHKAGYWLITRRGADWLHGRISVPEYVYTKSNQVIGHSLELFHKNDFKILSDFRATHDIIENQIIYTIKQQTML